MIFKEREKFALVNFLDVSKTSLIPKDHLLKELLRGEKYCLDNPENNIILEMTQRREIRPPKVPPKEDLTASQAGVPNKKPSPQPGSKLPPMVNEVQEANMITIVKKIEGASTMSLFLLATLENCYTKDGSMKTKDLEAFMDQSYGRHLNSKERALLVKTMDLNSNGTVDLSEFRDVHFVYQVLSTIYQGSRRIP